MTILHSYRPPRKQYLRQGITPFHGAGRLEGEYSMVLSSSPSFAFPILQ